MVASVDIVVVDSCLLRVVVPTRHSPHCCRHGQYWLPVVADVMSCWLPAILVIVWLLLSSVLLLLLMVALAAS